MKKTAVCNLIMIFIIAFALRFYVIAIFSYTMQYDTLNYHNMAVQFLESGFFGYSAKEFNAYVTPGYPVFLSIIYSIFGTSSKGIFAVTLVQAILSSITTIIIFFTSKTLFNSMAGYISALLFAFYPSFVITPTYHLTETLFIFLFSIFVYSQVYSLEKSSFINVFVSGFLFGLANLVRPNLFPIILAVILTSIYANYKLLLPFISGFIIAFFPWWLRNILILDELILFCTQLGNPLLAGAYPPALAPINFPQENQLKIAVNEIINGFKTNFTLYFKWFFYEKLRLTFRRAYLYDLIYELRFLIPIHKTILFFGMLGTILSFFKNKLRFFTFSIVVLLITIISSTPEYRYALPVMYLLIILSSCFVAWIVNLLISRLSPSQPSQ